MTQTSQQLRVARQENAPNISFQGHTLLKFATAAVFVCALALAPVPTFAQHGGGGGGGGGAHGGGGGGSHGSSGGGFGGGRGSAPSSNSGTSHASGGSAGGSGSSGNSAGGHWWNPFHGGGSSAAAAAKGTSAVPAGNIKSESSASSEHFAAGNNTWQEPPHAGMSAVGRVNYYGPANVNGSRPFVPIATTTRTPMTSAHSTATVAAAEHPFQPIRPGRPFYPFYPFFGFNPFYGGFGFGFGGYGPCSPFFGCFGYGFGYGYGFGGGLGYFGDTSGGYGSGWTNAAAEGSGNVTSPDNPDSYLLAAPGTGGGEAAADSSNGTQVLREDSAPQQPYVLLYLKDGSSFAVSDYWLADGKLHYVTSYGGDNAVDEGRVDLQRTVDENAARGVDFTLKPQPAGTGNAAAPASAPAQNPEPQKPQQ
jgi:hypothetical protein